ncbi:MAG: hypothetical protein US63_C0001G0025 [Candidatus Moranbacteria bacterium GW2011_GWC2_37_8]|nr:MAG: hypothetical protein US63_C0001G0025 [Candidatus Moranbacteria bacterium GW2011_GWC2_37_8]KKQ63076.1 MAG: hypothetical protein US82_C0003G0025 [Parcubacteria group bacterium GW2011_GWC1_38_22]KKQ79729.1 MAG: hypothetical protein UT03_C0043G0009 [Candidatus Moranbacteria bacterium GW2011_GWD2_38_7]
MDLAYWQIGAVFIHIPPTRRNHMEKTRQEHMDWCKKRALEYIERGDLENAMTSMFSDLGKHTETAGHPAIQLGMMLKMTGNLRSREEVKKFIEGFN